MFGASACTSTIHGQRARISGRLRISVLRWDEGGYDPWRANKIVGTGFTSSGEQKKTAVGQFGGTSLRPWRAKKSSSTVYRAAVLDCGHFLQERTSRGNLRGTCSTSSTQCKIGKQSKRHPTPGTRSERLSDGSPKGWRAESCVGIFNLWLIKIGNRGSLKLC